MSIQKKDVLEALRKITAPGEGKNMVDSGAVQNIVVFGDEVVVDVIINNPSMQAKKRTEVEVMKAIHGEVDEKAKVVVNVKVIAPEVPEIKGKPIPGIHNIIAVASGKGGVGKSTVTANLAAYLAKMGFKVGLLDADVYGPSMPMMLGVADTRPQSVIVADKSYIQPVESYGVKMLSIGFFTNANQAVIWRGPMAAKALNQLIFESYWGELDFLLIDLPPGTGDIHLSIMQALPITGAVVVSTPQQIALADARRGVAMFEQENINVPVLGIVENMAYFTPAELPDNKYYIFGKEGAKNLAKELGVAFLGEIPLVQSICESGDKGTPTALQEGTPQAEAFAQLAKEVVKQVVARNENLPPSEAIRITNTVGCSSANK